MRSSPSRRRPAQRRRLPLQREPGALRGDRVGVLVVEPDAALAEGAELDALALGHGRRDAAGPVGTTNGLWAPGVQSLKVPTADTAPERTLSGRTNWILVPAPLGVMRRATAGRFLDRGGGISSQETVGRSARGPRLRHTAGDDLHIPSQTLRSGPNDHHFAAPTQAPRQSLLPRSRPTGRGVASGVAGQRVRPSLALPVRFRAEDSPRGLWRSLGKRVGFTPSRVRIPHPPLI